VSRRPRGIAMFEVLLSLLLASVGVVAMAGLHGRAASMELEANQRTQALVLLQDMAERLASNRAQAPAYVADGLGLAPAGDCAIGATLADRDLCEWSERLRGAAVVRGDRDVGAMIGARGCVSIAADARFTITVAWQGVVPGAGPGAACGRGAFGDEALRRAVSTVVRIADLEAL
jgi:type IV pilus assembly protein PilV